MTISTTTPTTTTTNQHTGVITRICNFKYEGTVQGEMSDRGFCMIAQGDTSTYLFHSANLVGDDASKEAGNTVTAGHRVIFDAEWNHKHSPPKPFATNVRLIPGQDTLNTESSDLLWQRASKLDILDKENTGRESISPSGRFSVSNRSAISNRASALKSNGPVRRWTRTTDSSTKSDKPAGGLRMTEKG